MSELERAGERVEKQRQVFESLKPQLVLLEKQALERVSPRITDILQEAKAFIEEKEGFPLRFSTDFYFCLNSSGSQQILHKIVKEPDGQEKHSWLKVVRIDGVNEPVIGESFRYWTPWYWVYLDRPPEGIPSEDISDIFGWVNKNVKLDEIFISFIGQDEQVGKKLAVEFQIRPQGGNYPIWISYDERTGMEFREKLGRKARQRASFDIGTGPENRVDKFAESLYHFLEERRYLDEGSQKISTTEKASSPKKGEEDLTLIQDTISEDDPRRRVDQTIDDQRRVMQAAEERERVLLEIRHREARDSGYRRPAGIPEDAFSIIGDQDRIQTESDRFFTEEDFQDALHRQFPQGPDH